MGCVRSMRTKTEALFTFVIVILTLAGWMWTNSAWVGTLAYVDLSKDIVESCSGPLHVLNVGLLVLNLVIDFMK